MAIARASPELMAQLDAARSLDLPYWCIAAGAVRNRVWDLLHDRIEAGSAEARAPSSASGPAPPAADVDLVYFDPADASRARDEALRAQLRERMPAVDWDVVNQAGVHLWLRDADGRPVDALRSLEDGLASWPETATAVGLRLQADGKLTVIAPFGLDDLFGLVLRRNAGRTRHAAFRARLEDRQFLQRWPKLAVIDEDGDAP